MSLNLIRNILIINLLNLTIKTYTLAGKARL